MDVTVLNFSASAGGSNPASQAFSVANTGGGTLTWTAAKTQSWLSLDASSGMAPSTVHAAVNVSGLAAGTYHDTITITAAGAPGSPATISVTLVVAGGGGGAGPFAYVANSLDGTVSVIDGSTNSIVATIPVGSLPGGIAISPDGAFAYVTNSGSDGVSVIATASNTVVATVPVGENPHGVAITPDGSFAYVSNNGSGSLSVIATDTNTVVATVPVGDAPEGTAVTPDGAFVYVANSGSSDVSVIATDTNTVVATISGGDDAHAVFNHPWGVAITPDGAFAYVVNYDSTSLISVIGSVSVIETSSNTVVANIAVGFMPQDVAITPDGAYAYVTNPGMYGDNQGSVSVIATTSSTVVATIPVGGNPQSVAITPDGTLAYVSNIGTSGELGTGSVSVIETATNNIATTFAVGKFPAGIAFVPIRPSAPILSINPQSLTFNATAGGNNPVSQAIKITNTGAGSLTWSASKTQSWLSLDNSSGTAPSTIDVSVDITGLAAGTYHDTITFTADGASGSPVNIPVTLTVAANPILSVSPLTLTFTATVGGNNPAAQPLTIANTGSGTLNWTATKTQSWLSLDSANGTASSTIQVSVNIAGLAAGTYNDTITINATGASGSPQTIAVTLTVSQATDFKIDTPSGGNDSAAVNAGAAASYKLEATPLDGFTGAVSFTCSGLPSKSTCSFNPVSANITSAAPVPFTVAIATTAAKTSAAGIFTGFGHSPWTILAGVIVLLANLWLLGFRTRKWRRLMMLVLLVCALGTISCGGGSSTSTPTPIPGTPVGTYAVVLTSTSGSITHTTNLTLTVQ